MRAHYAKARAASPQDGPCRNKKCAITKMEQWRGTMNTGTMGERFKACHRKQVNSRRKSASGHCGTTKNIKKRVYQLRYFLFISHPVRVLDWSLRTPRAVLLGPALPYNKHSSPFRTAPPTRQAPPAAQQQREQEGVVRRPPDGEGVAEAGRVSGRQVGRSHVPRPRPAEGGGVSHGR